MNPSNLTIQVNDRENDQGPIKPLGSSIHSSPFYTSSPIAKSPVKKSPHERKTLRAKRPFKYLKHQGPRPIPRNSNNSIFHSNQLISINDSYPNRPKSKPYPRIRLHSNSDSRVPKRSSSSTHHESKSISNRTHENKPYSQSSSRLLKSRNLNLTTIDTSACQLSKKSGVQLLHDEPDSISNTGKSHQHTNSPNQLSSQHNSTSCFSAWSTTTSSTQLKSISYLSLNSNHFTETQLNEHLEKSNLFIPKPNQPHQTLQKRSISYHESNPSNRSPDPHLKNSILPWN